MVESSESGVEKSFCRPAPPLGVKTFILQYLDADVGPLAVRLN